MRETTKGYTCAVCGQYLSVALPDAILRHERSAKHLKALPPNIDDDDELDGVDDEGVLHDEDEEQDNDENGGDDDDL
jgi:hypothetical protein